MAGFAERELIEAAVDWGVAVRSPRDGVPYFGFCDPSGGARDSFTCGISHREKDGIAVLDCLIEVRAPFNPDSAVAEIARVLKSYRISGVVADRYAAEWPVAAFGRHEIRLIHSDRDRSEIYLDCLPLFTTGRVRLIENKKLVAQFAGLRRTSPSGRDKVDHGKNGADDCANSVAGALLLAIRDDGRPKIMAIGVDVGRPTIYSDWDYYAKRIVRTGNDFWRPDDDEENC